MLVCVSVCVCVFIKARAASDSVHKYLVGHKHWNVCACVNACVRVNVCIKMRAAAAFSNSVPREALAVECACACECVCVCVCVCVCAWVCMFLCMCVHTSAVQQRPLAFYTS